MPPRFLFREKGRIGKSVLRQRTDLGVRPSLTLGKAGSNPGGYRWSARDNESLDFAICHDPEHESDALAQLSLLEHQLVMIGPPPVEQGRDRQTGSAAYDGRHERRPLRGKP